MPSEAEIEAAARAIYEEMDLEMGPWDEAEKSLRNAYKKVAEAALAAAERARWQPIETAPKSVSSDELILTNGKEVTAGWWSGDKWYFNFGKPTHWQPLPSPPKSDTQGK